MTQPVWTLSVDLQTKTAVFQSGLADAAKSARGSFNDIKTSAGEMGRSMGGSMRESREGLRLLGEEFGVHLPRGVISFVSSLGPVAGAMEAAFPFLAIAVAATLFIEHLRKAREEAEKLKDSQINFGTVIDNVYTGLDNKLLEAGIRADELNNDHLAALNKQLTLIDHQSLAELVHSFDEMGKAADLTFAQLKTSWYQFGSGSEGAKHALTDFKAQYDALLAQGKDKEASDLLSGTRKSAEKVLELQKQAIANQFQTGKTGQHTDYSKFEAASNELKKQGIGFTDKEITAQQTLVDALRAQVEVEGKVQALKQAQDKNTRTETDNKIGADDDKRFRDQAQQQKQALDDEDKAEETAYRLAVDRIQQAEQAKIEATDKGSQARLNAIDAAIQVENAHGLQEEAFYKTLLNSRIDTAKQMADEQARIQEDAAREETQHTQKMGALQMAAEKESAQLRLSSRRVLDQDIVNDEVRTANAVYAQQMTALSQQMAALDKGGRDYEGKLKALHNRQAELTRQHELEITAIKDKAEIERNNRILSADKRFTDTLAAGLTRSITAQQSWGKMMTAIGGQVAAGMLENAIKSILMDDMTKEHDAAAAARKAYLAGMHFPFPANLVMAPALAAMSFAAVMAFEQGGTVPGVGVGDTVPAMLTPGEHVMSKQLTEHLTNAAKFGKSEGNGEVHVHHHSSFHVQALDHDGVDKVLTKHANTFAKHFNNHVRRMNKR